MQSERLSVFEFPWPKRVSTLAEAGRFLDHVGFCVLFPVKGVELPSLYFAAARKRPVIWDRYALLIWDWKDDLPKRKRGFYAKYFKGRGSFLSLGMLPHFLAIEGSAAAIEDAEHYYRAGQITHHAKEIWEALAANGPMATLELRNACKMDSKAGNVRFKKAMLELQRALLVVHFGSEQETAAWASGRFELTARAFPKQANEARKISPESARTEIAAKYLETHADAPPVQLARLFGWSKAEALAAIAPSTNQRKL